MTIHLEVDTVAMVSAIITAYVKGLEKLEWSAEREELLVECRKVEKEFQEAMA